MNRLRMFVTSSVIALAGLPALAQQNPSPSGSGPIYDHAHMWGGGWGWHPGIILGPFVLLLALIGVGANPLASTLAQPRCSSSLVRW